MQNFVLSHMFLALDAGNNSGSSSSLVLNGTSLLTTLNGVSPGLWLIAISFLAILIIITVLFIFVPLYHDQTEAYRTNDILIGKIDKIQESSFSESTKKELIEKIIDIAQEPRGVVGTTRRTLAVTILLVIGITVFMIVLISDNTDLINTSLASLTSVFATVIGFYFGSAQAKDIMNLNPAGSAPAAPAPPDISGISPDSGEGGKTAAVRIFGNNFPSGAQVSLQKSGQQSVQAKNIVVSPKSISCDLDLPGSEMSKGTWDVVITAEGSTIPLKNGFTIT